MKFCGTCSQALVEDTKPLRYKRVFSGENSDIVCWQSYFWQCRRCQYIDRKNYLKSCFMQMMCELDKLEHSFDEALEQGNQDEMYGMLCTLEAKVSSLGRYKCLQPATPPVSSTKIYALDREILITIFEKLDVKTLCQARQVSRTWFRIINRTPSLVGKFALSFPVDTFLDADCEQLKILKTNFRAAKLANLTICDVGPWCPATLQCLYLNHCSMTLETLVRLLRALPMLQKLTFASGHAVSCVPFPHVGIQLKQLSELVLLDIEHPSVLNLFKLSRPSLRVLEVPQQVSDEGPLAESLLQLVATVSGTLKELRVNISANGWCQLLVVSSKLQLKRFCVVGDHIGDGIIDEEVVVKYIAEQSSLEHLEIGGLSSKTLCMIGIVLPKLKRLRVHFRTGSFHKAQFLNTMPELQHLTLVSSSGLSLNLSRCQEATNVHTLVLEGVYPGDAYHNAFPSVRHLRIQGHVKSPAAPQHWEEVFGPISRLKNLQFAELHDVHVQKANLNNMASRLEHVPRLHLSNCGMSEEQLKRVILLGRQLKMVSLEGMQHVSLGMEKPGLRVVRIPPKEGTQKEEQQQEEEGPRAGPFLDGQVGEEAEKQC